VSQGGGGEGDGEEGEFHGCGLGGCCES
jgi:hypothetical protein